MKKILSLVAIAALGTLMSCSGSSPSAPPVPTPAADTWAVTALTAQPTQALVGETVTLTATITKNGSAAPDGTGVVFTFEVTSGGGEGMFEESSSDTVTVSTQGGKAIAHFYSSTESDYSIRARVQQASRVVTVSYSASEPLALYGIVPSEGAQSGGETVNLAGSGFTDNLQVTFTIPGLGSFDAEVISICCDHHSAVVRTPELVGADPTREYLATVQLSLPGVEDTAELPEAFRFVPSSGEPEIYSLYPAQGSSRGGDQVTVYGRNFTAPVRVTFATDLGTVEADEVSLSADGTQISLVTPPLSAQPVQGDHPADVTVMTAVGSANEKTTTKTNGFVFLADHPEPQITGVSPSSGPMEGGTRVTIFGTGFEFPVQVMFGTREANVINVSYDEIVCLSPDYTPTGLTPPVTVDVTVRNIASGLTSTLPGAFTYGESMFITGNSPSEGPPDGGTQVTIFGSGFRAPLTVSWVPGQGSQATIPLTVVSVSGNQIVAVTSAIDPIPCDDTPGLFRVTQLDSGVEAEGGSYTYLGDSPRIGSVNPPSAAYAPNTVITIGGSRFRDPVRVTFGSAPAQLLTPVDENTIDATLPDPLSFGLVFDSVACTGDQSQPGCQDVGTPVDVRVVNVLSGCDDTLADGFTYLPASTACGEVVPVANPTFIDFGNVAVNSSANGNFTLSNNGTAEDLTFDWTATAPDGFTVAPDAGTLSPGQSVVVTVTFTPTNAVPYGGAVSITATGGNCTATANASVTVQGTGQ